MKKIKRILSMALVMIVFLCNHNLCDAEVYTYGNYKGFRYRVEGEYVVITKYKGNKKKVTLPTEIKGMPVTQIESLKGGKNLKAIHIPADMTNWIRIENTPMITKVTVDKKNPKFRVKNNLLVDKKVTKVYYCPPGLTKVRIPNSVKVIGADAFAFSKIKSIEIPKNAIVIKDHAFSMCKELKSVTFNKKLKRIESSAFLGCSSLTSISIPDSVRVIERYAFALCCNLEVIRLSNKLKVLESLFSGGNKLKKIEVPKSVKKIEAGAINFLEEMEKVYIYNKNCKIYFDKEVDLYYNAIASSITIYGYKGSTAEKYAKKNGNKFVAL